MKTLKLLAAAGIVVAIIFGAVLVPCTQQVRETTARQVSEWNLRHIAVAMHAYHDEKEGLPPAVVRDRDGKPLYSWRVLLLPYLEEKARFDKFRLDEPWNSPHNKTLLEPTPAVYDVHWPEVPSGTTRYQIITGPGTAFERDGMSLAKDFPKGTSFAIMAVEAGEPVPWSRPADLVYDPNGPLPKFGAGYSLPVRVLCYNAGSQPGFNACLADGSCRWCPDTMEEQSLRAFITRNGSD